MFNSNYETLALSFTESRDKETLKVLKHFQHLKTENEEVTRTWNIEPGSEKPSLMKWCARDRRNQERLIFMAPGFSIKVAGPSFKGGIVASKTKSNCYYIALFNLENSTVVAMPPIGEEMLIEALDTLINGNPKMAA
jgi:hypothetical protein